MEFRVDCIPYLLFILIGPSLEVPKLTCDRSNYRGNRRIRLCPVGFRKFSAFGHDKCVLLEGGRMNWADARKTCQAHGGDLLKLRDQWDYKYMEGFLRHNKNTFHVWLGLHEDKNNKKYYWLDDTKPAERVKWTQGYPKSYRRPGCAYMAKGRYLFSQRCTSRKRVLCQRDFVTGGPPIKRPTLTVYPDFEMKNSCLMIPKDDPIYIICDAYMHPGGQISFQVDPAHETRIIIADDRKDYRFKYTKPIHYAWDGITCSMNAVARLDIDFKREFVDLENANISCCRTKPQKCSNISQLCVYLKTTLTTTTETTATTTTTTTTMTPASAKTTDSLPPPILDLDEPCPKEDYENSFPCNSKEFIDVESARTCLKFVDRLKSWDEARADCRFSYEADLVRVDSEELDKEIMQRIHNRSHNWWIGLHDRRMPGEFRWLDDDHEATYYNWAPANPKYQTDGQNCVVKHARTGFWSGSSCRPSSRHFYVCQKVSARNPGAPKMKIKHPLGVKNAYLGQKLFARCSAYVDETGKILFRIAKGDNVTLISGNDSRIRHEKDKAFVKSNERCFMKSRASLQINVTRDLSQATIGCCWYRPDGFTNCAESTQPLETKYRLHPPKMKLWKKEHPALLHMGLVLAANCSAFVGTEGQLVWMLRSRSGISEWRLGIDGTIIGRGAYGIWSNDSSDVYNETRITSRTDFDLLLGPRINSTFMVMTTLDLNRSTLSCRSYSPEDQLNTAEMVATSPVFYVYVRKEPSYLGFGSTLRGIVFSALLLLLSLATCLICVVPFPGRRRRQEQQKSMPKKGGPDIPNKRTFRARHSRDRGRKGPNRRQLKKEKRLEKRKRPAKAKPLSAGPKKTGNNAREIPSQRRVPINGEVSSIRPNNLRDEVLDDSESQDDDYDEDDDDSFYSDEDDSEEFNDATSV